MIGKPNLTTIYSPVISGLLLLSFSALVQGGPGGQSSSFLLLDPSARMTGMGGNQVSVFGHVDSMLINPAALPSLSSPEIALMHREELLQTRNDSVTVGWPLREHAVGFSFNYVDDGKIQRTGIDGSGNPVLDLGNMHPYAGVLNFAWAGNFRPNFSYGVLGKGWVQQQDQNSVNGWAGDAGVLAKNVIGHLDLGGTLKNVGPSVQGFNLPTTFDLGGSYDLFPTKSGSTLLAATWEHVQGLSQSLHLGAEIHQSFLSLRGGYEQQLDGHQTIGNLTLGAGIRYRGWQVDYGWKSGGDLGDFHQISILIGLGLSPEEKEEMAFHVDQAMEARVKAKSEEYRQLGAAAAARGEWDSAVQNYQAAIGWSPENMDLYAELKKIKEQRTEAQITSDLADGDASMKVSKWIDASYQYQAVLKLDPSNAEAKRKLVLAMKQIQASSEKSEKLNRSLNEAYQKGMTAYINGDFDVALKEWSAVMEKAPNWDSIQEYVAKAKSQTLLQQLQSKYPSGGDSTIDNLSQSAYTFYSLGQINEAVAAWRKILVLDPTNDDAHWALNQLAKKMTNGSQPIGNEGVQQAYDQNVAALKSYANGNLQLALSQWKKAVELDPKNIRYLNNLKRAEAEWSLTKNK